MSNQFVVAKCRGLFTFQNSLSSVPDGALLEALNVVIDADNVIRKRRGFDKYGTDLTSSFDRASQLFTYKNRILRHFGTTFQFDSDGAGTSFTTFTGSFAELDSGTRMKGIEANGNFYFTTSTGIKKLSSASGSTMAAGDIGDAGGIKALDGTGVADYSTAGFLTAQKKVAYRIVWGITDNNNNVILGSPSERIVVENPDASNSSIVSLTFTVPDSVDSTSYFYQIYRSAIVANISEPSDELFLVTEEFITSAEISAQSVTASDITPEDFREGGALLYTNPQSGEGIEQANEPPPFAIDITQFKGHVFYGNTQTRQRLFLDMLSIQDLSDGDTFSIVDSSGADQQYTFKGAAEATQLTFDTQANTTEGGFFNIFSANDDRHYVFYAFKAVDTPPTVSGAIITQVDISGASTADDVANAFRTQMIDSDNNDFNYSTVSSGVFTATCANNGNVTDATDGSTAMGGAFAISVTTQGDGEDSASNHVFLPRVPASGENGPSVSQQVDQAARSIVRIVNKNSSDVVNAFYLSGNTDVPGKMLFESKTATGNKFYINAQDATVGSEFTPDLPAETTTTGSGIATGSGTVVITQTSHNLTTGQEIVLYNTSTTPTIDGVYTVTNLTANTFSIEATVTSAGDGTYALTDVASDNDVVPNRIMFSKFQQPEAVPILNFIDVGPKDKEIKRILALRESLFILKEDGIWRLTGTTSEDFTVAPFDSSAIILAPDSAAILNNQIFSLTSQGVVSITDTGVSVVSRPIEDQIISVTRSSGSFATASFGIGYESDRAYLLWTVEELTDTNATQCYRFNTFTNTWTRWDKGATCGVVNSLDDKLYIGADDDNQIEKERKNRNRTDYSGRSFSLSIQSDGVNETNSTIQVDSVAQAAVGDAIIQTQYLTLAKYNQVLTKLDLDSGLDDEDYESTLTLAIDSSVNIRTAVTALAQKVHDDTGSDSSYTGLVSGSTDFETIQTEFNSIITTLNADTGVFFADYSQSSGTTDYEVNILAIDSVNRVVTVRSMPPLMEGATTLYKAIQSKVTWVPTHMGDPSIMKQVNQGSLILENSNITSGQFSFASDLSRHFEKVDFTMDGSGEFGVFTFGSQNFGGGGNQRPLRTYIPRNKQRCRWLNPRFIHTNANETFNILGINFTFRPVSERAWR